MTHVDAIFVPAELTPRGPGDLTPARRPGSVRRTSSLDFSWPEGPKEPALMVGRARDLLTPLDGQPEVLAFDELQLRLKFDRTILAIESTPARPQLEQLVGVRGGNGSRLKIADAMPDELENGTPLYLLLDDFPGGSLVSGVANMQSGNSWSREGAEGHVQRMRGVCTGFQPGSSALDVDFVQQVGFVMQPVEDLPREADPLAWHATEPGGLHTMRRVRRVDAWREDDVIRVDAAYQDSVVLGEAGKRKGVHEYLITATVDPTAMTLASINADPRILPWNECPLATLNLQQLVGTPMRDLRKVVLEKLAGTAGCTHLNDAARALAEVPVLIAALA